MKTDNNTSNNQENNPARFTAEEKAYFSFTQLENRIIQLEEKIAYLEIASDNLKRQRDDAMDRAKAKGERSAAVIRTYRKSLGSIVNLVLGKTKDKVIIDHDTVLKIVGFANDSLSFRRNENEQQNS